MSDELIDRRVFAELSEAMGDDFAAELVTTFLLDAPNMFAELTTALAEQDHDAYRRAAHSIKSNAQVFGAEQLAIQARDIETSTMGEDEPLLAALRTTYEETAAALKGLLNG